ncbi:MFS transporter [Lysinibacter sp. HNR]|uniref:MFS transporter n=1 Tax=Lysinibacter sp. HNR TaxID=3031408 RepID=UPI002435F633|nr:MFS transporter [Lysinibacter sp. HNR]WGD38024.1 MFS transporter [Lysinibacter sp. HNR]
MNTMSGDTSVRSRFPLVGLLILASATFLSVTIEMIPTGLMPEMSRDLGVTEAQIGLLLTVFAFTVVITVIPLTILTRSWGRRTIIIVALSGLALSTLLSAWAPSYELLVVARFVGGLVHGLFWSVVSAYAGYLVPRADVGRAVSLIVSGGTLAFVLGVPMGTALGQWLGWRAAFTVIALAAGAGAVLVRFFVPAVKRSAPPTARQRRQQEALLRTGETPIVRPSVWRDETTLATLFICGATALVMIGHYSYYSYIVPYLLDVTGISSELLPVMLFVFGIAGAVGLVLLGTIFSSRVSLALRWALLGAFVGVALMATFSNVQGLAIAAFVLWGVAFGMLPPSLQTTMIRTSSEQIRDTASAAYTLSFNTGIGGGALVGALFLGSLGLQALPWVNAVVLAIVLVATLVGVRVFSRRQAVLSALPPRQ